MNSLHTSWLIEACTRDTLTPHPPYARYKHHHSPILTPLSAQTHTTHYRETPACHASWLHVADTPTKEWIAGQQDGWMDALPGR